MSKELREFLQAWLDWSTNGAPDMKPFCRCIGLCGNVIEHFRNVRSDSTIAVYSVSGRVEEELKRLFKEQGLDHDYPFGQARYCVAGSKGTMHRSTIRKNWIRKQLEKAQ